MTAARWEWTDVTRYALDDGREDVSPRPTLNMHLDNYGAVFTPGRKVDRAMLRIHEARTGCDEYGIVVTDEELTREQVDERWHAWWRSDR